MHSMVNITLSPETYDIELRRRPIVSTASYDSGRFSSNAVCNGTQQRVASASGHERLGGANCRSSNVRNAPLATVGPKKAACRDGPKAAICTAAYASSWSRMEVH